MRALRVVGLHEDGTSVVCEDSAGEKFTIPSDERLLAAARGDLSRLGQIQITLESQMRPREIQTRIRSGETVAQVAAAAGIPEQRVERFAYPVLLERSRTAELAQRAHPVREDGPDVQTLGEAVAHAFGVRGQDYARAAWDSWRGDDGKWVVCIRWKAGRSDNRAHWSYSPGAHGGTAIALDEPAEDLMDPQGRSRELRPVLEELPLPEPEREHRPEPQVSLDDYQPIDKTGEQPVSTTPDQTPNPPQEAQVIEAPIPEPGDDDTTEIPKVPAAATSSGRRKGRKNHPVVPAWEDVLLGVKSQRG
ncbi:MAG: septation protein SepH [Thermocrispum sp.]